MTKIEEVRGLKKIPGFLENNFDSSNFERKCIENALPGKYFKDEIGVF